MEPSRGVLRQRARWTGAVFARMREASANDGVCSIGVLPGEGVGPEVIGAALGLLPAIERAGGAHFEVRVGSEIGRDAERLTGQPLPAGVVKFCETVFSDNGAILAGPGGGRFVYELRRRFDLFCKISPVLVSEVLAQAGRLKASAVRGTDLLVVRENAGGIYFGEATESARSGDGRVCEHTFRYSEREIRRIVEVGAALAAQRRRLLTVVVKDGGLPALTALWRQTAEDVAARAGLRVNFVNIDLVAYQLVQCPLMFDVVVADNLFGDVLADVAAVLLRSARSVLLGQLLGARRCCLPDQSRRGGRHRWRRPRQPDRPDLLAGNDAARELRPLGRSLMDRASRRRSLSSRVPHLRHGRTGRRPRRDEGVGRAHRVGNGTHRALIEEMRPLLLLVDLQKDFLGAPGLEPAAGEVIERATRLLSRARAIGIPVVHAMTTVDREPDDRMPHWRAHDWWKCVRGTEGHEPPASLRPGEAEPIVHKTNFSAFSSVELDRILSNVVPDTLIVAGVHLHGCVRATVLDAYARRLEVLVAEDAVASDDPLHAAITQRYLEGRAARFLPVDAILRRHETGAAGSTTQGERLPAAVIGGQELRPASLPEGVHNAPRQRDRELFSVPAAGQTEASAAARTAHESQRSWASAGAAARRACLTRLAGGLESTVEPLARAMAEDVGKPLRLGRAEVGRAAALLRGVAAAEDIAPQRCGPTSFARRVPLGVVAIVTPWNNPIAIPIGKIAPALAFANAVVWKPAPAATRVALQLLALLRQADVPTSLVGLLAGDHKTAGTLMRSEGVDGVSISGSSRAGWAAQEICAARRIPLQAELGGNNAAIVWGGADLPRAAALIARGAFSFAGQRCTANRRTVVDASVYDDFQGELVAATERIRCGDPLDPEIEAGPLISDEACRRVAALLDRARAGAVSIIAPHAATPAFNALRGTGAYLAPTLVFGAAPKSEIVTEETFGPVLVVQRAADFIPKRSRFATGSRRVSWPHSSEDRPSSVDSSSNRREPASSSSTMPPPMPMLSHRSADGRRRASARRSMGRGRESFSRAHRLSTGRHDARIPGPSGSNAPRARLARTLTSEFRTGRDRTVREPPIREHRSRPPRSGCGASAGSAMDVLDARRRCRSNRPGSPELPPSGPPDRSMAPGRSHALRGDARHAGQAHRFYVPLDPAFAPSRLRSILGEADAAAILTDERGAARPPRERVSMAHRSCEPTR